jgi:putative ABC transport system ATP-binding protein
VYDLGLGQQAGYGGRFLFPNVKMALMLARSLIRRPKVLILDDVFATFGQVEAARTLRDVQTELRDVQTEMSGRTLIVAGRLLASVPGFDLMIGFNGAKKESALDATSDDQLLHSEILPDDTDRSMESNDLKALRSIAIFADLDTPRLRLLAFTSVRTRFEPGETLFRQGEDSDAAYVVIQGMADVRIDTGNGPVVVSHVGENTIIGEMGIVTGAPRSASVIACTELTCLRLRKEVFMALMAEFPQMAISVTRLMVQRLQDNVTTITRADQKERVQ